MKVLKALLRIQTSVVLACFLNLKWIGYSVYQLFLLCTMNEYAVQNVTLIVSEYPSAICCFVFKNSSARITTQFISLCVRIP
jgi:hypothetical protein